MLPPPHPSLPPSLIPLFPPSLSPSFSLSFPPSHSPSPLPNLPLLLSPSIAGLPPYECEEEGVGRASSPKVTRPPSLPRERRKMRKRATISFDEYHALWKGIATSVTEYHHPNPRKDHRVHNSEAQSCTFPGPQLAVTATKTRKLGGGSPRTKVG